MKFLNVGAAARDCAGSPLKYDHACLEISSTKPLQFYMQYGGCEGCKLQLAAEVTADQVKEVSLSTLWPVQWTLSDPSGGDNFCNETTTEFGEFGHYVLNTSAGCSVRMTAEPDAAYLPLLETAVTLLGLATLWYLVKAIGKLVRGGRLYARFFNREDNELGSETRTLTTESVPRSPTRSRLRSLDVFRGAAIALMIFVNCGGGGYSVFRHAVWNGLTIADVVFPCFAWVMGASLVLSLNARLRTATPKMTAFMQVARRAMFLALIGILLGAREATIYNVRLPGVLQRLAACYLIVGALECAFMKTSHNMVPGRSLLRDVCAGWKQWLATLLLVTVQVTVSLTAAAPGCPRGYLGPGGLHMSAHNQSLENCTGGVVGYIDRLILGDDHLHRGGSYRKLYSAEAAFDPEGLLGCLSGALVVQAGAHAARIMLHYNHARARVMRFILWAVVLGVTGGALCQFQQDAGPIPINKNLWSLSYCLVTSGIAYLIHAILYFTVDLKQKWGGRPLYYAGENALAIYVCSELLSKHLPLYWPLTAPTHAQLLATHAATALIWLAVGVAMHRKRVFISL